MAVYSKEQRDRAVDLYERYDFSPTAVIHELGYPSEPSLKAWHRDREHERATGEPSTRGARRAAMSLHGRAETRGGRRLPLAWTLHGAHDAASGLSEKQDAAHGMDRHAILDYFNLTLIMVMPVSYQNTGRK